MSNVFLQSRWRGAVGALVALIVLSAVCLAGTEFVRPVAKAANTYPAHDSHDLVTVAIDPYDKAEKRQTFSVDWMEHGYLPVFVVITNDGEEPISFSGMKAQLVTTSRTKLMPATADDLYRRLSNPQRATIPSPLPLSDVSSPLPGANFFLMGVQNAKGEELMYFEVSLDKYLNGAGN
jgi:hypothetical protein